MQHQEKVIDLINIHTKICLQKQCKEEKEWSKSLLFMYRHNMFYEDIFENLLKLFVSDYLG